MKRVVIYARVSTEHEAQISALENQVQYYDEILKRHPEWMLVDRYIDEGITGTSISKRQSFLRMMDDAKKGMFDLVITREVSRFARNIVDTLQQTRILKSYGVEVWFTEDNIWTMNDEDGELRLSIMATLAQNESKKISQRVKAGQMISFKNGVPYGNGNILGYDRVDGKMVVNREQAKTVKRIFELYLNGNGVRKIQDILEKEHYRTASGLTSWQTGNINRILQNSFYCGRVEYRKQYVPDYLTQKKINNHGEIERVYVQGEHEPLISEEDFDKVQEIRKSKSTVNKAGGKTGKSLANNVWVKKLRCTCEHSMNRRISYRSKITGDETYAFQCYNQLRTGTPKHRAKKGLSLENICDNTTFREWKLEIQSEFIFKKLIENKQAIYENAMEMINDIGNSEFCQTNYKEEIEKNIREIDKLKQKLAVLVDMCTEGDISREAFREKKENIENKIVDLEKSSIEYKNLLLNSDADRIMNNRITALTEFIEMEGFGKKKKIPETIIDYYVEKIYYDKGIFSWFLRPKVGNELSEITIDATNLKKKIDSNKLMLDANSSTGCYRKQVMLSFS